MREIKFRAWAPHLKEMIQPCYLELFSDGSFNVGRPGEGSNTIRDKKDETILMQFTGLKDKNGVEIYDGDIVRAEGQDHRYLQVIEFHNSESTCGRGWVGVNKIREASEHFKTEREAMDTFSYFCWPATWEVIGNIFEHPHLLNK